MRVLSLWLVVVLLAACSSSGKEAVDATGNDLAADTQTPQDGVELDLTADVPEPTDLVLTDEQDLPDPPDLFEVADEIGPDIVPPDIQDVQPEMVTQEQAAFRLDEMVITEPLFCYPMGDACVPVLDLVNETLAEELAAHELHMLGLFEPFGAGEVVALTLGQAKCNLDNPEMSSLPIGHCQFAVDSVPATYEAVTIQTSGMCADGQYNAPCFETGEDDLAITFSGIVLGLSNVTVQGAIDQWAPEALIADATLHGYLPEELAKTIEVSLPSGEMPIIFTLYDLLEQSETQPETVDGHLAWPVTIQFSAGQIGYFE